MMTRNVLAIGMAAVLGLATPRALAAPTSEKAYKAAVKLEASGDVTGALAAFEAIPVVQRDFPTRLHIASCKYKLNRLLEAEADWEAIRTDPKADAATVETAASELTDVRSRIPQSRIRVSSPSTLLKVVLDDREVKDGEVARVNPGVHAVRASRDGTVVFERKLEIEQSTSVEIVVNAPEAPPSTTSSSAPSPKLVRPETELPEPGSGWVRAWPLLGVGLAFGAGFVVTRIAANSAARDVEDNCRTQRAIVCDTDAAGGFRVRAYETLSFVSAGLALTAFGAGIAIKITSHSKSPGAKSVIKPAVGLMNGITLEHQF